MLKIICTTDPISGKDLQGMTNLPFIMDEGRETTLQIYFESEANKRAFMDIPVEHPIGDIPVNLDNPTDEFIDEG